ncbi:MAG TPA: hypothetical protein VNA69_21935 [Thermoanaerobaculia bacterium]|nr:hypothetical protein [Thermoanaerobaculia bacterium]
MSDETYSIFAILGALAAAGTLWARAREARARRDLLKSLDESGVLRELRSLEESGVLRDGALKGKDAPGE